MLIRKSGLILNKNHEEYSNIVKNLTRNFVGFTGEIKEYKFYEDLNDNEILIPRFYPIDSEVYDISNEGENIEIETNILPRNEAQKKAMDWFVDNRCGVLRMEPGRGKTVVTIHSISKIKKKTIIITHKTELLLNWKDEILKYTNLEDKDINILKSKNSKKRQKIFDKSKIIIATPQTISSAYTRGNTAFFEMLNNAGIGMAVFDECHVGVGPEKFSFASLFLNCNRVYGLSATPVRFDGNEDIIEYHLGNINYIPPMPDELINPKIIAMKFPFDIYSKFKTYLTWGGNFSFTRYYNKALDSQDYMNVLKKLVLKCYANNKNILVLGYRKNVLLQTAKSLNLPKTEIGIFIPSATSKERLSVSDTDELKEAFQKKRIVFSTYGAARDGNNRPDLDCLIMSFPTSNIEQAIGRIQRYLEGKDIPLVFDLIDEDGPDKKVWGTNEIVSQFVNQYINRKIKYDTFGWEVKELKINVKKFIDGE